MVLPEPSPLPNSQDPKDGRVPWVLSRSGAVSTTGDMPAESTASGWVVPGRLIGRVLSPQCPQAAERTLEQLESHFPGVRWWITPAQTTDQPRQEATTPRP